jgi:hypothetical protein
MTTFVNDTFTDSDGTTITSHTGETGATWAITNWGSAPVPTIQSNELSGNTGTGSNVSYYASGVPGAADYTVSEVWTTASAPFLAGPGARMATGVQTGYFALRFSGQIRLYKYVSTALTQLGSGVTFTWEACTISITVTGTTIAARVQRTSNGDYLTSGGSWSATPQDAVSTTDSAITDAGKAGFWHCTNSAANTTPVVTSFTAVDSTVPSSTGTVAVTEAADTSTASGTVTTNTIAITSTDLVWSPFNWYSDGGGAMQASNIKASSTYAQSNNVGAYLKFAASSIDTGSVNLLVDTSMLSSITSGDRPMIGWTVDGGAIQTAQLTTVAALHSVALGTNLGSGTHQFVVYVYSINFGNPGDRWTGPALTVRITGIALPAGGASVAVTAAPRRMLVYGDSIAEGAEINGVGTGIANGGGNLVWGNILRPLVNAEIGVVAYSGQAYSGVAASFDNVWDLYHTGASRLTTGAYTTTPDAILINHGKNGTPSTASIEAVLDEIADAAPAADIVVIPTFDRTNAAAILAATLPANARFLDLGPLEEYPEGGGGDWASGVHMNALGHSEVAALIAAGMPNAGTLAVTEAIDTSTASGTVSIPPIAAGLNPVSTFASATVVRTFNA